MPPVDRKTGQYRTVVIEEAPLKVEPEPPRSMSPPPGTVVLAGKGWKVNVPAIVVTGLLSAAVGAFGGQRAGTASEVSAVKADILSEVRAALREDRDTRRADLRDALEPLKSSIAGLEQRERHNIPLLAAVANKLGSNLKWEDGTKPQADFHAAPLTPRSPPVQPKDTLLTPPP